MAEDLKQDNQRLFEEHPVWRNFQAISQIPRPSFKEKAISDWTMQWAQERGLYTRQDEMANLIIKKPATQGYEDRPTVLIQAHFDMVCQAAPGVKHDFDKDPIQLELDGDILSTGGLTSLGADDGIGLAMAMAILEEKDLKHGPLEILFTVAEEEDLSGAQKVDTKDLEAEILINIDNAVENELLAGSCGGSGLEVHLPITRANNQDYCAYKITLKGLPGGHSGEDIHRGHGNANLFLGRVLQDLNKGDLRIAHFQGGNFRLAIPREAEAVILLPCGKNPQETVDQWLDIFKTEYASLRAPLKLHVEAVSWSEDAVSLEDSQKFLKYLFLNTVGISEMSNAVLGVVDSSSNLGELTLEKDHFKLVYEIRGSLDSTVEYLLRRLETLADCFQATHERFASYTGWSFRVHSPLRDQLTSLYEETYGRPLVTKIIHSGLECGSLLQKMPHLDAVSLGPDAWGLHSPTERISISSSQRIYDLLKLFLEKLPAK